MGRGMHLRKGIILAGGTGSRLYPVTRSVSKQLLPVYDKPMIYYPMSTLMLAGIREILIISTATDIPRFKQLLGDGHELGLNLSYCVQDSPDGIAQAFILGKEFIGQSSVALILGDNIFYGHGLSALLDSASRRVGRATVFAQYVSDPERFGVIEFNSSNQVVAIEEKPEKAKSNFAITGLYFYDNDVVDVAASIEPSDRGELEITDVNKIYLESGRLSVELMGRGYAWLDTGTHDSLHEASSFIATIQKRQGLVIACLEEIAYSKGWITEEELLALARPLSGIHYGQYLKSLVQK